MIGAAAAVAALSTAATAAPGTSVPPNAGSRPVPEAGLEVPGSLPITTPTSTDPDLLRISGEQAALEGLGERINESADELAQRTAEYTAASTALSSRRIALQAREAEASQWARKAYIDAAARPTSLPIGPRAAHDPTMPSGLAGTPLADLAADQRAFAEASRIAEAANATINQLTNSINAMRAELAAKEAGLAAERVANADKLHRAEQVRDAANEKLSAKYLKDADGTAAPQALAAVRYALAQVGKPYVFGDEGPETFDCSGLVWAAYESAHVHLPRTARKQYYATRPSTARDIPLNALHTGDLLFFGPNRADPESIHHVAIYLGRGEMVHAPEPGEKVKVSPIWWEEFWGATRVVAAPPAPKPKPSPPAPIPSRSPSPQPSPSPPKPSPSPPRPSPDPPASPSPSPSPSPDPTPSASSSPSGSGGPPSPSGTGSGGVP